MLNVRENIPIFYNTYVSKFDPELQDFKINIGQELERHRHATALASTACLRQRWGFRKERQCGAYGCAGKSGKCELCNFILKSHNTYTEETN
jgi:hypothetical protein